MPELLTVGHSTHPLDAFLALVSGAGVKSEGGTWYLVAPSGKPIKSTKRGDY